MTVTLTSGMSISPLTLKRLNFFTVLYNTSNSVRTSQDTNYVFATKPNRLMLFGGTVAVYFKNHMKHINALCGQNVEFCYVKADGTYSDH
jgi:hypothetical protein